MPSSVRPNDVKQTIPSASGSFCEKFLGVFRLPLLVYQFVSYIWNEDGTFTDEFKVDICALGCKQNDSGFPVPIVAASDGQFADKIGITWTAVSGATLYDLYRNTINSPTTATLFAADLTVLTTEDLTVVPNSLYYYWVKAKNATQLSGFGQGDSGYAGTLVTSLNPIVNLVASHGISDGPGGVVELAWTKVTGADSYDIYRGTTNNFVAASVIALNAVPVVFNPLNPPFAAINDNGTEITCFDTPGAANGYKKYYYWVIAKRTQSAPPANSPVSNSGIGADGWVYGDGSGSTGSGFGLNMISNPTFTSDTVWNGGYTHIWFALQGCGGGGAGGGLTRGGGGGGAPAVVVGRYVLPALTVGVSKFRVRTVPITALAHGNGSPGGVAETDGDDGGVTTFELSAAGDFSDTIIIATCDAPEGGKYNASGNGAGGAGATGTVDGAVTQSVIYDGRGGESANGSTGGKSGYSFAFVRNPPAHFNGFLGLTTYEGNGLGDGEPGSGSMASPTGAGLAIGGFGRAGRVVAVGYLS